MDPIKEISGDWRTDKWNLVAKTVTTARTDAKSCLNDLKTALRAFPSPAPVRSAVDMLELYQRILFNTMDAHEQTLASKEAELVRMREALRPFSALLEQVAARDLTDSANVLCQVSVTDMRRAHDALTQPTE